MKAPLTLAEFMARVETSDGCWLWHGARSPEGYGRFTRNGTTHQAHRASYELHVGPIPEGLVIDHLCRNTSCVNPAHLEPITHAENIRRGYEAKNQTHCKRGHDLSVTARITRKGSRDCRACESIRRAERAARLAAETAAPARIRVET